MAVITIERTVDLDRLGRPEQAQGTLYQQEEQAHKFIISAKRNGQHVDLSGTVSASFIRPDGVTVPLTGAIESGCATVTLDDQCYDVTGRFTLTIFTTDNGASTAIYSMTGNVRMTETDAAVDPGTIIPSVANLINQIGTVTETIPPDATQLRAAMAGTYSSSATYSIGDYAWYDGTLYRCTTAILTAETWTAAHWTAAAVVDDVAGLKSAFDSANGIDLGTMTSGKYINRNDGTEGADSNGLITDFISIIPGMTIHVDGLYMTGLRGLALYNSDKEYLSKPTPQAATMEFVVPLNAYYMRMTAKNGIPYQAEYVKEYLQIQELNTTKLNKQLGMLNKGKFLLVGVDGELILSENFKGAVNSSNPIDANQINENGWYSATSSGKSYFSHIPSGTSGVITVYTTMKVGGGSSQANQICIDQYFSVWGRLLNTSNQTPITDWVQLINTGTTPVGELQKSRWYGKTIECFGDSRTWYNGNTYNNRTKSEWAGRTCVGYQQTLAYLTGATITSDGHSGATSPTICEYIRAANLAGIDAVLLEGGVNDYIVGAPSGKTMEEFIGTLQPIGSTFDTSTIYGAWQSAVEYILANYPQVKIFMTIPAIAWDDGNPNTVFPYSIAEIKGKVAELYNIPCVDLYKHGGLNAVNRDYYYVDDVDITDWRLHFNDYGNALIGAEIAGFINTH